MVGKMWQRHRAADHTVCSVRRQMAHYVFSQEADGKFCPVMTGLSSYPPVRGSEEVTAACDSSFGDLTAPSGSHEYLHTCVNTHSHTHVRTHTHTVTNKIDLIKTEQGGRNLKNHT